MKTFYIYNHEETGVLTIKEWDIIVIDYLLSLPYIYIMTCQIKTCEILGGNGKYTILQIVSFDQRIRITNISKNIFAVEKIKKEAIAYLA